MQLKYNIYYKIEIDKLVIYQLLPEYRKFIISGNMETLKNYYHVLEELDAGDCELSSDHPLINFLISKSMVMMQNIVNKDNDPFKRQLETFEAWDTRDILPEKYQERLAHSNVLVIGAGGLGTPIVNMLCNIGIGKIVVADDDIIEISNLSRQFLYSFEDVGKSKVEVISSKLNKRKLSEIIPFNEKVKDDNVGEIIRKYDINLITGIDISESSERMQLIDKIADLKIPLVCVSEHSVGPLVENKIEFYKFKKFVSMKFPLQEDYLKKRSIKKKREMHPSIITDLSMVAALCVEDIYRYLSKLSKPRLLGNVYSLNPITFNYDIYEITDT
ncbi:ThiF family adenylyltransferase [Streptococcus salivarius]|uniref:ThiF family adenylyltransferase n=1 Tax=Streptococcus salivarius TaxID=1304 RepID=UPI0009388CBC|nr:ThiF family adenylyltransferase [Streptococcus salivarius]MDU2002787.1 ThiF family adenylyltransferase [Streptococcus salivarius]MDU2073340.1 ThiF family adenylyltransferase [Streptococcus salivarius]